MASKLEAQTRKAYTLLTRATISPMTLSNMISPQQLYIAVFFSFAPFGCSISDAFQKDLHSTSSHNSATVGEQIQVGEQIIISLKHITPLS